MAKHLYQLTNPLSAYIGSRFKTKTKHAITFSANKVIVPDVLLSSFLLGESLFRNNFFSLLEDKYIFDPHLQALYWQKLMVDRKYIQEIVENISLLDHFKLPSNLDGSRYQECCFTAYCILLWDIKINESESSSLLISATRGFILHYLPSLYPKQTSNNNPKLLKSQISSLIARRWQQRVIIKESFKIESGIVQFSLIAKAKDRKPEVLINHMGERLKTTRLEAYKKVLKAEAI